MSRGHGNIQRTILQVMREADRPLDTVDIAGRVFGVEAVNSSQHQTARRALRRLRDEGLVHRSKGCMSGARRAWATTQAAKRSKTGMFRVPAEAE
jgi:Fe2+ or Zn2+ uptake regulation protein